MSLSTRAMLEGGGMRIGQKEIFLPTARITLLRSDLLGPDFAKFRVPLYFSKLDLRDYLWHAYRVEIHGVRSYVKQSRVRAGNPRHTYPATRRWHRPQAQKFMTVNLARPFVWPEVPEDFEPWNRKEVEEREKWSSEFGKQSGQMKDVWINEERRDRMREQAKLLLEGKARWRAPENKLTSFGLRS